MSGSKRIDPSLSEEQKALMAAVSDRPDGETTLTARTRYDKMRRSLTRLTLNLIMTLDAAQIENIRNNFQQYDERGVSLPEFVQIMTNELKISDLQCTQDQLVRSVVELFTSMDLDGDRSLDFDEFLATIVHMGMGSADHLMLNPVKPYREGPQIKSTKHHTEQTIRYIPSVDKIMVSEVNNHCIKFYEPSTMKVKAKIPTGHAAILASEYIYANSKGDIYDMLVASTSQHMYIWEGVTGAKTHLTGRIPTQHPLTIIRWHLESDTLYSGDMSGTVQQWTIKPSPPEQGNGKSNASVASAEPQKDRAVRGRAFKGHTQMITALEHIPSMDLLLTSSLDSTIRMWDLVHGNEKLRFTGHRAGVVDLAYSDEYRFLLSASIDHEIGVWSPFADRLVLKLTGHSAPLVGVEFVHGTPQIVSADAEGWVKVWDARNFNCIQTFSTVPHVTSFATCGEYHKRTLVAGKHRLYAFDQEGGPYSKMGEEDPAFAALYNNTLMTFLVAGHKEVKIWNALNGTLSCIYRRLSETELTAVCLDDRKRKLITGDHHGRIRVFNYLTGAYMKSLQSHDGEITFLGYVNDDKAVVSVGRDNYIMVHDERPIEDKRVLSRVKVAQAPGSEITACAYSPDLGLYGVASTDGSIYLWTLDMGMPEGVCKGHEDVITCMAFLDKWPLMVSADDSGNINFWFTRPSHHMYTLAFSFVNIDDEDDDKPTYSVTAIAFDAVNEVLYTGDSHGDLNAWDLKPVIALLGHEQCPPRQSKSQHALRAAAAQPSSGRSDHHEYERVPLPDPAEVEKLSASMKPTMRIRAHKLPIKSVEYVAEPPSLITAANSPRVHVWSVNGDKLGTLDPAHATRAIQKKTPSVRMGARSAPERVPEPIPPWDFHMDVEMRERRETEMTSDIMTALRLQENTNVLSKYGIDFRPNEKKKRREQQKKEQEVQRRIADALLPVQEDGSPVDPELALSMRVKSLPQGISDLNATQFLAQRNAQLEEEEHQRLENELNTIPERKRHHHHRHKHRHKHRGSRTRSSRAAPAASAGVSGGNGGGAEPAEVKQGEDGTAAEGEVGTPIMNITEEGPDGEGETVQEEKEEEGKTASGAEGDDEKAAPDADAEAENMKRSVSSAHIKPPTRGMTTSASVPQLSHSESAPALADRRGGGSGSSSRRSSRRRLDAGPDGSQPNSAKKSMRKSKSRSSFKQGTNTGTSLPPLAGAKPRAKAGPSHRMKSTSPLQELLRSVKKDRDVVNQRFERHVQARLVSEGQRTAADRLAHALGNL